MFSCHLEFLSIRRLGGGINSHQVDGSEVEEGWRERESKKKVFSFLLVSFPPNNHPSWWHGKLWLHMVVHRTKLLSTIRCLHCRLSRALCFSFMSTDNQSCATRCRLSWTLQKPGGHSQIWRGVVTERGKKYWHAKAKACNKTSKLDTDVKTKPCDLKEKFSLF